MNTTAVAITALICMTFVVVILISCKYGGTKK
jgi:hypothetical protein